MKPVSFDFVRPSTLEEASRLLVEADGGAKILAGGQSLSPMLNLRLVHPRMLVDITGIAEMTHVEDEGDALTLGACITTAAIEDGCVPLAGLDMLPAIAGGIAYRAVRNRGTIGGSVCHADPAADWISTLVALNADCVIRGRDGNRRIPVEQFFASAYEVALAEGDILQAIRIPRASKSARWGYEKICRKRGEFAMAIGAVLIDPERNLFRGVIGATAGRPIAVDLSETIGKDDGAAVAFNEEEGARLLAQHGIKQATAQRLHLAALNRAIARAIT